MSSGTSGRCRIRMTSSTTLLALSANVSQLMKLPSVDPGPWPESRQPLWSNVAVFKLLAKRESPAQGGASADQIIWDCRRHLCLSGRFLDLRATGSDGLPRVGRADAGPQRA